MSGYTKEQLLEAIDAVLDGDKPLRDWDYIVSVNHKDEFTAYWGQRLRRLEENYTAINEGKLITDEGIRQLEVLREELVHS
jgi:hypothetical protein